MNAIPARHHVVPRHILKDIANEDGRLFAFDRRSPQRGVFSEHYEKLLVQKHFYSYHLADGAKDPGPENWLAQLEGEAAPLFVRIIEQARRGVLANLNSRDHQVIERFVYFQWKRSPDAITAKVVNDIFDRAIEEGLEEYERLSGRPIAEEAKALFSSEDFRKRLRHNARVSSTVANGEEVLGALRRTGTIVARIANPKKSFAVGSRPVAKLTLPGDTKIGSPNVELWMPIAHDVALVWCGPPVVRLIEVRDDAMIRNTNTAIARQSTLVAARSEALVRSLIKAEPVLVPTVRHLEKR